MLRKNAKMNPKLKKGLFKSEQTFLARCATNKAGYDFILLVEIPSYTAKPIEGALAASYVNMYRKDTNHQQALMQAVQNGVYHYEWSTNLLQKSVWFQTTCIALPGADGKIPAVLCLSRDISRLGEMSLASTALKEWTAPKTFSQILLAAREAERKEISKALHDEVGSSAVILLALLSLVKVNVKKGNTKRALRDLEQLSNQIKQGIDRLRGIIVSLRPPTLDNAGGLCVAVRDLLEQISTLSHIPYQFQCKEDDEQIALSENVRILLFRIVQEALTNIVKHAHAKCIVVSIKRVGSSVRLQVRDDGVGFDPKQSVSITHVGLLAMKDSVELLGGKLLIKSAPGKGTRIEVECPSVVYGGKE